MEQTGLERTDAMKTYLQEISEGMTFDKFVERRLETIWTEFAKAVEAPVKKLAGQKIDGAVVISYLRSSIVTGSHVFYIAYYNGEPFVEEEPESIYLDLHQIFEVAEADCMEINRILGRKFVRVLDSEKEEIRRWYLYLVYERLGTFTQLQVEENHAAGGIPVLYGGYMEKLHQIGDAGVNNRKGGNSCETA
ncbi:MAG: hypothetical protein K2N73_08870 [Lachnospiraceae bacterium]|nr:hypothetical protein [Lachnospiraceae bacterium]